MWSSAYMRIYSCLYPINSHLDFKAMLVKRWVHFDGNGVK